MLKYNIVLVQCIDIRSKTEDIVSDIVQAVSSTCGCDFTSDHLTDSVFLCSSSSPNSVTYQAQLHGTPQANASQLAEIIHDEFYTKRKSVYVLFSLLPVVDYCKVLANNNSPCRKLIANSYSSQPLKSVLATTTEQVTEEATSEEKVSTSIVSPTVKTFLQAASG